MTHTRNMVWCAALVALQCVYVTARTPLDERFDRMHSPEHAHSCLGYDPRIRMVYDQNTGDEKAHPTIYLHGFGDDSNNFLRYLHGRGNKPYLLSCPAIFFDFPDAALHQAQGTLEQCTVLQKTSLGQINDILPFVYVLNTCRMAGYRAVDVFGFSRGATTALNTLAVLKNGAHKKELARVGVGKKARLEILHMLQNGCITLDCPLKNLTQKFSHDLGTVLGRIVSYALVPLATHHKPWHEEAIDVFDKLGDTKLNLLIHYEENDRVVSNWADDQMYEKARALNKEHTYVLKSNDGGHVATRRRLPEVFHAFKQLYGYTPHKTRPEEAQRILQACQPDRC